MKTSVKYGIFFALIWMIINMVVFYTGYSKEAFIPLGFVNLFLLMAGISLGIYLSKKEKNWEEGIFLADFKTAMQSGIVYAILASAFIYFYHEKIDPGIRESIIEERMTAVHEQVPDEATYQEMQAQDPTWADKSYDDYIENMEDQFQSIISAFLIFILNLAALALATFFFSFFIVIILRKVVLKGMR